MNELISAPPLRLRVYAATAKWVLRMLAAAWLAMVVLWCGLHFLIVPRIADLRPWAEQQASKALGLTVRIGDMQAHSNGIIPSVALLRVTVFDQEGREALLLPSVTAALSPRSVLGWGFEQLHIDSPVLEVRRKADGSWWVAGLALASEQSGDDTLMDWLFSQPEVAIVQGSIQWTDEMRDVAPVQFQHLDLVIRNRLRTHSLRLDADPPAHWGARLSLQSVMREPLLSRHAGQWRQWEGQVYADFSQIHLAELARYVDLGIPSVQGNGALRAWLDVQRGALVGGVADVQLSQVRLTTQADLLPMELATASGRLGMQTLEGGTEWHTEGLQFVTQDGIRWPGGNLRVQHFAPAQGVAERGTLIADRLDLAALAQIAQRLPLQTSANALVQRSAPAGVVDQLQVRWSGPLHSPSSYSAQGRVRNLRISACQCEEGPPLGVEGLDADFDFNEKEGTAHLLLRPGVLDANGLFEEPRMDFEHLSADVGWKRNGAQLTISSHNVRFANADAQGELQFKWHNAESRTPESATPQAKGLGTLELQGSLSQANVARVHRYLPLTLGSASRDYLRTALLAGSASNVRFKVKGDLSQFPFTDAQQGEFHITARLNQTHVAFAPESVLAKDSLPWPVLQQLQGELSLERDQLRIQIQRGAVANSGLQFANSEVRLTRLYDAPVVGVTAEARGPLADLLTLVNTSPLGAMLDNALARSTASGTADYKFKLALPLEQVHKATVQGSIVFTDDELQITPETPTLSRTRGTLQFTESGFSLAGAQARALGGEVKIEGGLSAASPSGATPLRAVPTRLHFSGTVSAEGLRQARELGAAAQLAQFATGSTSYTASLGFRSGVPELQIHSTLVGMGLTLPAPFAKSGDAALPVDFETTVLRPAAPATPAAPGTPAPVLDQLRLDVGNLARVVFVRELNGTHSRVLRGSIGVGLAQDESAPLPAQGVVANLRMDRIDTAVWAQVLETLSSTTETTASAPPTAPAASANPTAQGSAASGYLPTVMVVRAQELLVSNHQLNNVVIGGGRDGALWRANLDATELSGYVEYRQPSGANPGRIYARLARLSIGQSTAQDVESLLDEQPSSMPALDIEVDNFELRGKKLGRISIEAVNLGGGTVAREWRLNRFNILLPEAQLTASGNWANMVSSAAQRSPRPQRRTALNFKLNIQDSGQLLERLGMPGVVRKGSGSIAGEVAWAGSPISVDYPSMAGAFNVNIETGQFLKAEPGIAKLLSVLSLQSLPRRLTLDFRDVFSEGFAFDYFRGDVVIEQGIAKTSNLQMKGVNAAVLMDGQADIAKETQNLRVVVVPEINAGSASLIASTINPVVGLGSFLAQLLLRGPLVSAATREFTVDGTWLEPKVTPIERKP